MVGSMKNDHISKAEGRSVERSVARHLWFDLKKQDGQRQYAPHFCLLPFAFCLCSSPPSKRTSNGNGNRSRIRCVPFTAWRFARTTGMSPQYSQSNCRHGPHGGVGALVSATTAIIVKSRFPSESALSSATRSAQTVRPYDAFSTLHPVYT